jgi:hypothetical protein
VLYSHALFAAEIQYFARKYGFGGCFRRGEQLLVATRSSFSKGAFQNDIC